ncbi:MAG: hypothetical protein QM689_10750 [Oscillospiraceae bacterium]
MKNRIPGFVWFLILFFAVIVLVVVIAINAKDESNEYTYGLCRNVQNGRLF